MRTRIKTVAIYSALLVGAVVAGAQERRSDQAPNPMRKPAEFKCPVCGSPCVSKAELRQRLQRRLHWRKQQVLPNQPIRDRQRLMDQGQTPQQWNPERAEHIRQQVLKRFDFNGDGQLSQAERAAMHAYRDTTRKERGIETDRPATHPSIDE